MEDAAHNQMVSLIWNIADDVLRDVFLRGQKERGDRLRPICGKGKKSAFGN